MSSTVVKTDHNPQIVAELLAAIRQEIEVHADIYHNSLFRDEKYVYGRERQCHQKVAALITAVAKAISSVARAGELKLVEAWRPDIVLRDEGENTLCVVEYESLNSSDTRVLDKDVFGYVRWLKRQPRSVPPSLLVMTTLPKGFTPAYRLRYTQGDCYNWEHEGRESQVRENPFHYWYSFYANEIGIDIRQLPIYFANFDGNELSQVKLESIRVAIGKNLPHSKPLKHDSDSSWYQKYAPSPKVVQVRSKYKDLLWNETDPSILQTLLPKFWDEEQAAWGANGWNSLARERFLWTARRVRTPEKAVAAIEGVQWCRY